MTLKKPHAAWLSKPSIGLARVGKKKPLPPGRAGTELSS
jgi:hypothetical protein